MNARESYEALNAACTKMVEANNAMMEAYIAMGNLRANQKAAMEKELLDEADQRRTLDAAIEEEWNLGYRIKLLSALTDEQLQQHLAKHLKGIEVIQNELHRRAL